MNELRLEQLQNQH